MEKRTIAAISTPLGPGGIGIIRVSGPQALHILRKLFVFQNQKPPLKNETKPAFSSHHVYHGYIHEKSGEDVIDEVLAIYMKGPKSYTREDVIEIQSHSGYVVLERLLSEVMDAGAELARPGEFTQRAFLNGRIDLTQAEAVIDLINAPCETAAKIAIHQASGRIKVKIDQLIGWVTELYGKCEALIEFEESDDLALTESLFEIRDAVYDALLPQIARLIQSQKSSAIFHDGALMTIAGVPNVGKSSLLNQLVEQEIAIVSEIPGTTRDVVREYHSIHGIPVVLCDTAGLHETQDPVECIGIDKAQDHIERAELLLFVVEATRRLNSFEKRFLNENKTKRAVIIINKVDIADTGALEDIKKKLTGFTHIAVSAKTGSGISDLRRLIFRSLVSEKSDLELTGVTPNLRQRKILEKIEGMILAEIEEGGQRPVPELMADTLGRIRELLEEITGSKAGGDLYDYIFSQFCIGK